MVVMANAIRTARVIDVDPVIHGSLKDAVKQKRDFCKIKPKQHPNAQKRASVPFLNPKSIPITMIAKKTPNPMGS